MKDHLEGLNKNEINYAWSFELITPENGVVLESGGKLLEMPFDLLMDLEHKAILGKHSEVFGSYFPNPVRLSGYFWWGQPFHSMPSLQIIHKRELRGNDHPGRNLLHYGLFAGGKGLSGFQEDINPDAFRLSLENSQLTGETIEVDRYIQNFPSRKHELFLIPNGTVHSSGINNLVWKSVQRPTFLHLRCTTGLH